MNRFNDKFSTFLTAPLFVAIIVYIFQNHQIMADQPPDLPGDEITDKQYFDFKTSRDSVQKEVPEESVGSPTWLDRAATTWDAPTISSQLAEDNKHIIHMGKGAIFIPYMSDANLEPELEILNEKGKVVASGSGGRKYSLAPGLYRVMLGSGSQKQKVVKTVQVTEGKISTVLPTWCGLSIDVVDKDNIPFRGEYELARIDKFIPLGRGLGRDLDLGEKVKTWILSPGVYKIFGVGESYNTLKNFVTVRLLPGEFTRFVLVENSENDMTITGGGTVEMATKSNITSNWKYGIDIGGGIDFNIEKDRHNDTVPVNEVDLTLLTRFRLEYKKDPFDWESRMKFDEEFNFKEFDANQLSSQNDELRLTSIFTWHLLQWLGPYGRLETITGIIPQRVRRPDLGLTDKYYFLIFDESLDPISGPDPIIDSISESYRTQPSFSPITLEAGIGANMNILSTRFFESRILTGIGFTYEKHWDEKRIGEKDDITPYLSNDTLLWIVDSASHKILINVGEVPRRDVGPEILLYTLLRAGRIATIESELKYFAPFSRMEIPDLYWRFLVSWKIFRMMTLDYEYRFTLVQPEENDLKKDESKHRVLIRFSYTSR